MLASQAKAGNIEIHYLNSGETYQTGATDIPLGDGRYRHELSVRLFRDRDANIFLSEISCNNSDADGWIKLRNSDWASVHVVDYIDHSRWHWNAQPEG